jgi:hypothetical protein
MAAKYDYFAMLSVAVAGLERDAYAARGAIYDREHKALLRRLLSPDSTFTNAEIDEEQHAFREAVRRIEFASDVDEIEQVLRRRPMPQDVNPAMRADFPGDAELPAAMVPKAKRPIFGRVIGRIFLAMLLLAVAAFGWGYGTGQMPWLTRLVGQRAPPPVEAPSGRAILFDGELTNLNEKHAVGQAVWRSTLAPARDGGVAGPILHLDARVPERKLALQLSMQQEVPGGAMSHLIHLRFVLPNGQPDDSIEDVLNILTRTDAATGRTSLPGSMITVAPGIFLFGLDGQANARQMGMRQLKGMRWMDLPLRYRNGARGILTIEVGAEGQKVINAAVAKWEQ